MHKTLSIDLSRILKSPEIQRALWAPRRVQKKNPLKNMRISLKPNPCAKAMSRSTMLHQAKNHELRVGKAAAALEAKSLRRKEFQARSLWWGRKQRGLLMLRSRRSLWWEKRLQLPRNQQLRGSPRKRNPPPKKRGMWHKQKLVYSVKVKSFSTAKFE